MTGSLKFIWSSFLVTGNKWTLFKVYTLGCVQHADMCCAAFTKEKKGDVQWYASFLQELILFT